MSEKNLHAHTTDCKWLFMIFIGELRLYFLLAP